MQRSQGSGDRACELTFSSLTSILDAVELVRADHGQRVLFTRLTLNEMGLQVEVRCWPVAPEMS